MTIDWTLYQYEYSKCSLLEQTPRQDQIRSGMHGNICWMEEFYFPSPSKSHWWMNFMKDYEMFTRKYKF